MQDTSTGCNAAARCQYHPPFTYCVGRIRPTRRRPRTRRRVLLRQRPAQVGRPPPRRASAVPDLSLSAFEMNHVLTASAEGGRPATAFRSALVGESSLVLQCADVLLV